MSDIRILQVDNEPDIREIAASADVSNFGQSCPR